MCSATGYHIQTLTISQTMADSNPIAPCSFGDDWSVLKPSTWFRGIREYTRENPALWPVHSPAAVRIEKRTVEFTSLPTELQQSMPDAFPSYRPPEGKFITETTYRSYQAFNSYIGTLLGRDREYPNAGKMISPVAPRWENVEMRIDWDFPDPKFTLSQLYENKSTTDRIIRPRPPDNDFKCFPGQTSPLPDPPPGTLPVDLPPAARRVNELRPGSNRQGFYTDSSPGHRLALE
jgi:hypothetical protein